MNEAFKKYEEYLLQMKSHEEDIFMIRGQLFLIRPATESDLKRLSKGNFCMD